MSQQLFEKLFKNTTVAAHQQLFLHFCLIFNNPLTLKNMAVVGHGPLFYIVQVPSGESVTVRCTVRTLVGEAVELLAHLHSSRVVLSECELQAGGRPLNFDMRLCAVPRGMHLTFSVAYTDPNIVNKNSRSGPISCLRRGVNLTVTIRLMGAPRNERRRIDVVDTDPVFVLRDELFTSQPTDHVAGMNDYQLFCDNRPILNDSLTFRELLISESNLLEFRPRKPSFGGAHYAPVDSARDPQRVLSMDDKSDGVKSPRSTNYARFSASHASPPSSFYRHLAAPTPAVHHVGALFRGELPLSPTQSNMIPSLEASQNKLNDYLSIVFADPDDNGFLHSINVHPDQRVSALFGFVAGGSDHYNIFCDGRLVVPAHTDSQVTFFSATNGSDGCVFSFQLL